MSTKKIIELSLLFLIFVVFVLLSFPVNAYIAQRGLKETYGQYAYIQTGHCKIEEIVIINLDRIGKKEFWTYRNNMSLKWADTFRANSFTWYNAVVMKGCND